MLTTPIKSVLFLTSLAPLIFIFYVRQYNWIVTVDTECGGILILTLAILSFVALALLAHFIFVRYDKMYGREIKLDGRTEPVEKETLFYFIASTIPFVGIVTNIWTDLILYAVIFIVIYILYVKLDLIHLNPLLLLLGFRTYKMGMAGRTVVLITKKRYQGDASVEMMEIGDGVYYEPRH